MNRRLAWFTAWTLGVLAWGAAPASAQTPPDNQDSNLISMDFGSIELLQAIQFIIRHTDVNLVTSDPLTQTVTVKMAGVQWRTALESVLKAHGYAFVEEDNILRIIAVQNALETERRVPLVLSLRHTSAEAARQVLQPLLSESGKIVVLGGESSRTFSVIDTPESIEIIQDILDKIDVPPAEAIAEITKHENERVDIRLVEYPLQQIDRLLQTEFGLNVFVQGSLAGLINLSLRDVKWEEALTLILRKHDYAYRIEKGVVIIGRQADFKEELITQEFNLRYVDGWDLKPYLEKLLTEQGSLTVYSPSPRSGFEFGTKVTERRTKKEEDGRANGKARVLSVTDRPANVSVVAEQVKLLDVKPQQVEVDVKIVEIRHSKDNRFGVDWNAVLSISGANRPTNLPFGPHSGKFFPGNFPTPPTGFSFGSLSASQLTAALRIIHTDSDAEVVSEPNLTTMDNIEASILIGQKFPVTSETIDPQTAVRTVTLDYYEDIGIQLLVVPTISEGNRIHLVIHPAVSTVAGLIEDRFPIIDTREADTQLMLRSGDTAVIGGLISRDVDEVDNSIPFLGKIPILGWLFRYQERVETSTELVIFVTPRIVADGEQLQDSLLIDPRRKEALEELKSLLQEALEG